ncbi:aldehyde dehydrogenase family protein [Photobacterium sp. SDRW27]|uniref:aldehyde dehydrogenase family protein n=1 Tax=Photobacterium obscurum TaxID=2829490 RepID=UPI0022447D52|nr:aldehyde dehydrogenase family protein [Photobacterium obscurum]MCW8328691.1 aldehyde dehydrogenase family protein [Photobacterium obscurum]
MTEPDGKDTVQHTVSPVDGRIIVSKQLATQEDVQQAIEQSNFAEENWRLTSLAERKFYCSRAIDALLDHREMIACELSWMMGRPIRYSGIELSGLEERARYMIAICDDALATVNLEVKPGFTRYIKREPLGTVVVIAPWNYPYLTAINSIIPALLAGNTVILKHSSQTPLCAERLQQAFNDAGLPDGVFQHLYLSHAHTEYLIASEHIQHVVFTGSVKGGQIVERAAAGHFHGIGLELGGKDPAYVRADANLNQAAEAIVDGALFNSGQSCCGIERVYVDASIHDEFVAKATQIINNYQLDSPLEQHTTLGPLVRTSAAEFVREQITEAVNMGATAHVKEADFPKSQKGTPYLAPQLLTGVNHQMRIMKEETFGPVVAVQKVHSDDEAIVLMNDSEFGLTASIFTQNYDKAIALGEQLETGTFFVNRCDYLDPALAWTGVKHSGRGYALSTLGFETLTRPKSFHIKHL